MKLKSFRFRIALLSALLAGCAIAGFSGITYLLFYQSKLNALDSDLRDQLTRESSAPRPDFHWRTYEQHRSTFFGEQNQNAIAILVIGANGTTTHQSQNWQTEFYPESLFPPLVDLRIFNLLPFPPPNANPFPDNPQNNLPSDRRPPRPDHLPPRGLNENPPIEDLRSVKPPPNDQPPRAVPNNISSLVTRNTPNGKWRIGAATSPFVKIAIAINLQVIDRDMSAIQNVFLIAVPFTLLLVMLGAWWLSGGALKTIKNITETIRRVNAKGLHQRTAITDLDMEFVELVQVFNQMMERLERSFLQASRFSADAAHELKTPLAILQGELELALQHSESNAMQATLSNLLDEVCRLSSITRKLLLLSLADAGKMTIHKAKLNISEILYELVEDIEILAPELTIKLEISSNLMVMGDRELLTQVLQNLITNAIKYNLPNGWIQIQEKSHVNNVSITISNSSQDISQSDRDRIFDRFHRADPARNRGVEGFGLGLSLSREIVRAHDGDLKIAPVITGCTSFTLILPIYL